MTLPEQKGLPCGYIKELYDKLFESYLNRALDLWTYELSSTSGIKRREVKNKKAWCKAVHEAREVLKEEILRLRSKIESQLDDGELEDSMSEPGVDTESSNPPPFL